MAGHPTRRAVEGACAGDWPVSDYVRLRGGSVAVRCGGQGFSPKVAIGDVVAAGELLVEFDLELLARRAASLVSPVGRRGAWPTRRQALADLQPGRAGLYG